MVGRHESKDGLFGHAYMRLKIKVESKQLQMNKYAVMEMKLNYFRPECVAANRIALFQESSMRSYTFAQPNSPLLLETSPNLFI